LRLGVLGGTFDPVHVGHLLLAEEAREQLGLEQVRFVPAGQPWRKAGRRISNAEDRLAMLRLAAEDNPAFEVSDLEVSRLGPSYTGETLASIRTEQKDAEIFFILGEDALADLPNWRDPDRIVELAVLAVARRPSDGTEERDLELMAIAPGREVWLSMPRIDISSSEIRERVQKGLSVRYRVPDAVEAYIGEHNLYMNQENLRGSKSRR
jgi:nicotinate-nucleotide adenylyltransferase